jgi:hypothetical protein
VLRDSTDHTAVKRAAVTALVLSATLVLAALGIATGWMAPRLKEHGALIEGGLRLACAMGALWLGIWLFGRLDRTITLEVDFRDQQPTPDFLHLQRLQSGAASSFTDVDHGVVATFVELVTSPERYRSRVAETINLDGRSLQQSVLVEFALPRISPGYEFLYLPLLHPFKGELVDDFHLRDANDGSLPDLSHEETTQLASAGLRLLIAEAAATSGQGGDIDIDKSVRDIELALLQVLAARGPVTADELKPRINTFVGELVERLGADSHDHSIQRLTRYVRALSHAYPIVAVIPASRIVGNRLLLKYARAILPTSQKGSGTRGLVRLGLGLRPNQVFLPAGLAFTGQSYHLRVNGPDGT